MKITPPPPVTSHLKDPKKPGGKPKKKAVVDLNFKKVLEKQDKKEK